MPGSISLGWIGNDNIYSATKVLRHKVFLGAGDCGLQSYISKDVKIRFRDLAQQDFYSLKGTKAQCFSGGGECSLQLYIVKDFKDSSERLGTQDTRTQLVP